MQTVRKAIPFEFIIDELADLGPLTKPMFGCTAIYVGGKIVLILRQRNDPVEDDGIWLATTEEHHESLQNDFPSMRSIKLFGPGVTGWQVLPAMADDFEESAFRACEFVRNEDPRIGKIPKKKLSRKRSPKKAAPKPKSPPKKKAAPRKKAKTSIRKNRS